MTPEPVTHEDEKQLEAFGWKLHENINDPKHPGKPYQMANRKMQWKTEPYATPQLATAAARTIQKHSKQKGVVVTEAPPDERFAVGAVPPEMKYARRRSFPVPLRVALSPEQINQKLDEFNEVCGELETLEKRFEEVKKTWKSDIEKKEAEKLELERVLRRRADDQDVQVEERVYDIVRLVVQVRTDTGVIAHQWPMQPEEAQENLLVSI